MADNLIGKWQSDSYENMDALWDALNIPAEVRKLAQDRKTELTVEKEGAAWKLTTVAGDKSRVIVFPPGQEVDTITLMGQPVKAVLTEENGQLVERQKLPSGEFTLTRGIVGGSLKTTMTVKGVSAAITFTKA